MIRILFIFCVVFFVGTNTTHHRCTNKLVPWIDKIILSPIIVFGQLKEKEVYFQNATESVADIRFQVECILKGQYNIEKDILMNEAGIKISHAACQSLKPGLYYIVFLEKFDVNTDIYHQLHFPEHEVDEATYELLERTCNLTRLSPLHSRVDKCPNVSLTAYCPYDEVDLSMTSSEESANVLNISIKSFNTDEGNHFRHAFNGTTVKNALKSKSTYLEIMLTNKAYSIMAVPISMFMMTVILTILKN